MRYHFMAAAGLTALGIFSGCAPRPTASIPAAPKAYLHAPASPDRADRNGEAPADTVAYGTIVLREVLSLTMHRNPDIAAALQEIRIREAGIGSAGLLPNPELEFEAEEFGGAGSRRGLENAELSVRLSQVVELGGKRSRRIRAATLEHELAIRDFEIRRQDILTEAAIAFIELLGAQERLKYARETEKLAGEFSDAAGLRVSSGKAPPIEETRARVSRTAEQLKRGQAERALAIARKRLAVFWGEAEPQFESAMGSLENITPVPRYENPEKMLAGNPEIKRWATAMEHYTAMADIERAHRIPDVSISGGAARFMGDDENALVMGFSVPLPLFDRNQWNIRRAERELAKIGEERRADEHRAGEELFTRLQTLTSAYEQAMTLLHEVAPAVQRALDMAEEGYKAGKFSYLETLDTQRELFERREQALDALILYHTETAKLERLCGESMEELLSHSKQ